MAATKMQQSLAALERAFVEEAEADGFAVSGSFVRPSSAWTSAGAIGCTSAGSMRFVLLVLVLLATAALVTVAMFKTLYVVMG